MQTRADAESRREVLVTWSVKRLRHDVRQHCRSLVVLELHFTTLDFITDVMILDVNVLGTTMVDRVPRHLDAGLVVFHDVELWCRLVILQRPKSQAAVDAPTCPLESLDLARCTPLRL